MATKVFLDANVLLDFVLKRKNHQVITSIFELEEHHKVKLFISSSILHIIGYWLSKYLGSTTAKITMIKLLSRVKVVEGSHESSVMALESDFSDIEDALQYSTALLNKMAYLISFDKGFQKFSSKKLPIIDAEAFLKII